ncbi:MAG: sigma-54-dependent Fis family transcriptional regulator [Calditrichaeota bacterium]|nr:MAG: sigma-54-dependent Fis family transcriptional regulator [Calditrichota bacterium]
MKILLIDDDKNLLKVNKIQLEDSGYKVITANDGQEGLSAFKKYEFDLILCDIQMPKMSGKEVLQEIRKINSEIPFIVITAYGSVDDSMEMVRFGANDYIQKPFGVERLVFTIEKNYRLSRLNKENKFLKQELKNKDFIEFKSESPKCEFIKNIITKIKDSSATVLITGETGVGKEIIAKNIHFSGNRQNSPFVEINCASVPDTLIESELFGHEKGAFTGANEKRIGKFEFADKGTIFLDEIGDLKPDLQAKLLRVLQEKKIERIGGNKQLEIDVRVIAATHRNLLEQIPKGLFREDLFFRLNVIPIQVPSLRERKEDILPLAEFFLKKYNIFNKNLFLSEKSKNELLENIWKGNVRELENTIERAVLLSDSENIDLGSYSNASIPITGLTEFLQTSEMGLEEIEIQIIKSALEKFGGNKSQTAKALKIERHILLYKLKKYKI